MDYKFRLLSNQYPTSVKFFLCLSIQHLNALIELFGAVHSFCDSSTVPGMSGSLLATTSNQSGALLSLSYQFRFPSRYWTVEPASVINESKAEQCINKSQLKEWRNKWGFERLQLKMHVRNFLRAIMDITFADFPEIFRQVIYCIHCIEQSIASFRMSLLPCTAKMIGIAT